MHSDSDSSWYRSGFVWVSTLSDRWHGEGAICVIIVGSFSEGFAIVQRSKERVHVAFAHHPEKRHVSQRSGADCEGDKHPRGKDARQQTGIDTVRHQGHENRVGSSKPGPFVPETPTHRQSDYNIRQ